MFLSVSIAYKALCIAGIIEEHAHRIGTLSCSLYDWSDHRDLLHSLASINFPILKHLALTSEVEDWGIVSLPPPGETCPALVSIDIEGVLSRFPLRQLPSLTAVCLSCDRVFSKDIIAELRGMLTQISITHLEFDMSQSEEVTWPSDMT